MSLHKVWRSIAERLQEQSTANLTQSNLMTQLAAAIKAKNPDDYVYVLDIIQDTAESGTVVYQNYSETHRCTYTVTLVDGNRATELGAPVLVLPRTVYDDAVKTEPTFEATREQAVGELVMLREGAVLQDGTAYLKLISPGWNTSTGDAARYYPAAVLERDGPKIYKKGTKNYWNHQTEAEESARPEGDLRDLASVLTEDATWDKNGPAGAGLYARASVFENYRPHVDALASHIGVSIRAMGMTKEGTAEGRKGTIVEKLTRGISVDYVTEPGAGGEILQLFEAARGAALLPPIEEEKNEMTEAEIKALVESSVKTTTAPILAENASLKETVGAQATQLLRLRQRSSVAEVREAVAAHVSEPALRLTEATQGRIIARICAGAIPVTEAGELDAAKLKAIVEAEIKDEVDYLAKLTNSGAVIGMGSTAAQPAEISEADAVKQLTEHYTRQGFSAESAAVAARGRN